MCSLKQMLQSRAKLYVPASVAHSLYSITLLILKIHLNPVYAVNILSLDLLTLTTYYYIGIICSTFLLPTFFLYYMHSDINDRLKRTTTLYMYMCEVYSTLTDG